MYDPVLATWRRRRGRDTYVERSSTTIAQSPEIEAAVKALAQLGMVQGSRIDSVDDRVKALEKLIADIGTAKR